MSSAEFSHLTFSFYQFSVLFNRSSTSASSCIILSHKVFEFSGFVFVFFIFRLNENEIHVALSSLEVRSYYTISVMHSLSLQPIIYLHVITSQFSIIFPVCINSKASTAPKRSRRVKVLYYTYISYGGKVSGRSNC